MVAAIPEMVVTQTNTMNVRLEGISVVAIAIPKEISADQNHNAKFRRSDAGEPS